MGAPVKLDMHTRVRLELLFKHAERREAKRLLLGWTANSNPKEAQRLRFAALKMSGGSLEKLKQAIELGKADYRDLLLEAGFAGHTEMHQRWWPGQELTWPSIVLDLD